MHINTSKYGRIELEPGDRGNFTGTLLSGSGLLTANGSFGNLAVQEFHSGQYSIVTHQLYFNKRSVLKLALTPSSLHSISYLKGKAALQLPPKISMYPGQFLLHSPTDVLKIEVQGGQTYFLFHVLYQEQVLTPLLPHLPLLATLLHSRSSSPHHKPCWITKHSSNFYEQLLDCPYEPPLRDFLFDDFIRDLLINQLWEIGKQPEQLSRLSSEDERKIHYARSLILQDLKAHFCISALSRKVELNEFKLKYGFRVVFGKGPFSILKEARMELARELLIRTNRPIKDIISEAGYKSITSFVKSFREVYGVAPGQLRQQQNNGLQQPGGAPE